MTDGVPAADEWGLQQEILQMIHAAADCPAADVTLQAHLVRDLGLDSLELAGLLVDMEVRYGTTLDADQVARLLTVADLLEAQAAALQRSR